MLSPPKKMEPIKASIFTLPPALSLKYETYFQKQTFLFDFFGVFVTKQIMDFSWGYPLHNHHSAKKKKCRITKEFQWKNYGGDGIHGFQIRGMIEFEVNVVVTAGQNQWCHQHYKNQDRGQLHPCSTLWRRGVSYDTESKQKNRIANEWNDQIPHFTHRMKFFKKCLTFWCENWCCKARLFGVVFKLCENPFFF